MCDFMSFIVVRKGRGFELLFTETDSHSDIVNRANLAAKNDDDCVAIQVVPPFDRMDVEHYGTPPMWFEKCCDIIERRAIKIAKKTAPARKAYEEVKAPARKAYEEVKAQARKAYIEFLSTIPGYVAESVGETVN